MEVELRLLDDIEARIDDRVVDVGHARRPRGYVLTVDPMVVDLHRFLYLIGQARTADRDQDAADLFEQEFGSWRGDAFATLDNPWINTVRAFSGHSVL